MPFYIVLKAFCRILFIFCIVCIKQGRYQCLPLCIPEYQETDFLFGYVFFLYIRTLYYMKNQQLLLKKTSEVCSILLLFLFFSSCMNGKENFSTGEWKVTFNKEAGDVNLDYKSKKICNGIYASYRWGDKEVTTRDYARHKVSIDKVSDVFGKGRIYKVEHTDKKLPKLVQYFYFYPDKEYVMTDFTIEGKEEISSNRMAPVNMDSISGLLPAGDNRALFVPFDNDKWIRYQSHPLNFDKLVSYEVTAVFNNDSRNGFVIGSVEHDNWKTAVSMHINKDNGRNIGSLVCYGGVADELTRDVKAHGALTGKKIKSPKVFIGFFEDWCDGLEAYAKANAAITPPKAWEKAVPFGWNSWGALQFNLTYEKAMEVSDFIKENLQNNHFINPDQTLYIGLDSGWDCMNEEQLKSFINKCKSNGQIGGIYWTPFTDWARNPERTVDAAPEYKYKDIYLYANGKPQELDGAYAIDPTHPAVEAMMKKTSELFRRAGFEYVKMDFMTHGAMEADKWYRPEITTGIQGYNYGMVLLNKYFGDMYINLSISPVFPAQYAQSRRIACDAWNKIKDTEYTLNALSYGWWQKYIYQYNDADHIVLRDAEEGENRARITSGVITGIYITGDDFSAAGGKDGKEKSLKYLTNAAVNAVATGEVFRPAEGNGEQSEHIFIRKTTDGRFHCAIFNYSDQEQKTALSLERIGLDKTRTYQVTELWSGNQTTVSGKLDVTVPSKDVQLLEFK